MTRVRQFRPLAVVVAMLAAVAAGSACSDAGDGDAAKPEAQGGTAAGESTASVALRRGETVRVSVGPGGRQANGGSREIFLSPDGGLAVFRSFASNLVPGDRNGAPDVFLHDLASGETERLSVNSEGEEGNRGSCCPHVSADERFVAFASAATNLVPGDRNGEVDIFVHDRQTGETERVSVGRAGTEANGESAGTYLSADGRFVAFSSEATNLVPADRNGVMDGFLHDRETGVTRRVAVNGHTASLSADGRFIGYRSFASNLVPGDTNGIGDVFVLDRQTGRVERVNVSSRGEQANAPTFRPTLTPDGRFVVFRSHASNLVPGDTNRSIDVFLHDRRTGRTERVSVTSAERQVSGYKNRPFVSDDGRFVIFRSISPGFVRGDTNGVEDVFVRDRRRGTTRRVSVSTAGRQANGPSGRPGISGDGRVAAFPSTASNLVRGDTNRRSDVFVHGLRGPR